MKIKVKVSTNKYGSTCEEEIEVNDGTEEEIGQQAIDYITENMIDWTWCEID